MIYLLKGDNMKILFFSDIHGIYDNLEYIRKKEEKENFDKIIVLGDLLNSYNYFSDSDLVLEFLNKYANKIIGVKGNCDSFNDINKCNFKVEDECINLCVDDIDICMIHGDKLNKYNDKKILIFGHLHYPYINKDNNILRICVGSISLPRNNTKPSYLVYENKEFTLYDIYENVIDSVKL